MGVLSLSERPRGLASSRLCEAQPGVEPGRPLTACGLPRPGGGPGGSSCLAALPAPAAKSPWWPRADGRAVRRALGAAEGAFPPSLVPHGCDVRQRASGCSCGAGLR